MNARQMHKDVERRKERRKKRANFKLAKQLRWQINYLQRQILGVG